MDGDRRTCLEGRARFPLYKAHVASTLPNVERLMPKPWFEELVCEMARVRIRCERGLGAPHPDAPPIAAGSWQPAAGSVVVPAGGFGSSEAPSPTSAAGTA
ncbi:MAG TPA: hypothetical protein VHM67_04370 [Gemmatimonadaceae bacterium]|nr:hypothetical protein [Gemmatimonadaceae bacterium]